MTTTAEIIVACQTAATSDQAVLPPAGLARTKWHDNTVLMDKALKAQKPKTETYIAIETGKLACQYTRDVMDALSSSMTNSANLYTKLKTLDVLITPKTVVPGSIVASTASGTINFDVGSVSTLYYSTTSTTSALNYVNFRASSTSNLSTLLSYGQSTTVRLLTVATTADTFVIKIDNSTTGVSTRWLQTGTATGTTSMIGYNFTIMRTDNNTNSPNYLVLIATEKYSSTAPL